MRCRVRFSTGEQSSLYAKWDVNGSSYAVIVLSKPGVSSSGLARNSVYEYVTAVMETHRSLSRGALRRAKFPMTIKVYWDFGCA